MYAKFLQWRKQEDVDNIDDFDYPELSKVKEIYPFFYHKTDRFGRPVYIEILGKLDAAELLEHTTMDRFVRYHVQAWENLKKYKLPACSMMVQPPREIVGCCTIMDLNGVGMRHFSSTVRHFLGRVLRIDQDYYPEHLGIMFIINAPVVFTFIWRFIRPFLDERTSRKIVILGSRYKEHLLATIPKENLPEFLGGTSVVDSYTDVGPWDAVQLEGTCTS